MLKNDLSQRDFKDIEMKHVLMNKDYEIQSQELKLREAARKEEAAERFIGKLDMWKQIEWRIEVLKVKQGQDGDVEQGKSIIIKEFRF